MAKVTTFKKKSAQIALTWAVCVEKFPNSIMGKLVESVVSILITHSKKGVGKMTTTKDSWSIFVIARSPCATLVTTSDPSPLQL